MPTIWHLSRNDNMYHITAAVLHPITPIYTVTHTTSISMSNPYSTFKINNE